MRQSSRVNALLFASLIVSSGWCIRHVPQNRVIIQNLLSGGKDGRIALDGFSSASITSAIRGYYNKRRSNEFFYIDTIPSTRYLTSEVLKAFVRARFDRLTKPLPSRAEVKETFILAAELLGMAARFHIPSSGGHLYELSRGQTQNTMAEVKLWAFIQDLTVLMLKALRGFPGVFPYESNGKLKVHLQALNKSVEQWALTTQFANTPNAASHNKTEYSLFIGGIRASIAKIRMDVRH